MVERQRDRVHLLRRGRELGAERPVPRDKENLDMVDQAVLLVLFYEAVADVAEAKPALHRLFGHAHLLALVLWRDAHHVALGKDVVLHELHAAYGAEGLLVVAAYVVHMQQHDAAEWAVALYRPDVRPHERHAVLRHKRAVGRHAGEVPRRVVGAAELIRRVPPEHKLVSAEVAPSGAGLVRPALRPGGGEPAQNISYCGIVELHIRTARP